MFKSAAFTNDIDKVIFAVDTGNPEHHVMRYMMEKGIPFRPLLGQYKGVSEMSFVIDPSDWQYVSQYCLDQESILLLGKYQGTGVRDAYFLYQGDSIATYIGQMGTAPRSEAMQQDGYTFDPSLETWFIIREKAA